MTANDLSADELAEALLRGASGMYTSEAAIRLLLAHGVWAVRLAAAHFIGLSDEDEPEEPRVTRPTHPRPRPARISTTYPNKERRTRYPAIKNAAKPGLIAR